MSAVQFLEGNFQSLKKGSYCGLYPHQLGLAALEEGIFRLANTIDYHIIQYIFVLMIVGSIFFLYQIMREMTGQFQRLTGSRDAAKAQETGGIKAQVTGDKKAQEIARERVSLGFPYIVAGTLLGGVCMAPVFYSCWVYGEVPYVFFALLAVWMLMKYLRNGKGIFLALFVLAVTFAMLVRENALILIVAFGLTAAVRGLETRDWKLFVAIACAVALPLACYQGIFKMYEIRSGYEHSTGLPSNDFVYIGLQETEGRYGWDYYKSSQVYYDNGRDTGRTAEAVDQLIAQRWEEMKGQPGYLKQFFKGKILSQWNAPLYQSMYFNYVHEDVHKPKVTAFLDKLSGEHFFTLLWEADRMQFILYLGMFCYFVFAVRGDSDPLRHILAVTIIGGFLFSVIWEAKTRYIFPYYMMMFPMAVQGYQALASECRRRLKRSE